MNTNLKLVTDQEAWAVGEYAKFFPQNIPTIFQQEMIEATVTDAAKWREALTFWAGNDYRPQSIQKLLDYYKQSAVPTTSYAHVSGRPTQREAIRAEQARIAAMTPIRVAK